jgi:hypothetical protein
LLESLEDVAKTRKGEFREAAYAEAKVWLHHVVKKYLLDAYETDVKLIHFDEVQSLMGRISFTSTDFDDVRANKQQVEPKGFFMSVFCDAIGNLTFTSTAPSYLARTPPRQFNPDSATKVRDVRLLGRFKVD